MTEDINQNAIVISTELQSSPSVFDLSGNIPFSISICAVRRNTYRRNDPDPRPLRILVRESLLDIPYALKTGLIRVVERTQLSSGTSPTNHDRDLDFSDIDLNPTSPQYLTVDSAVGFDKTSIWAYKDRFVSVRHVVLPESQIGSRFAQGKTYDVKFKGQHGKAQDFPVRWWNFNDTVLTSEAPASNCSQPRGWQLRQVPYRLGQSLFRTRSDVPLPPPFTVHLSWTSDQPAEPCFTQDSKPTFIATITNTSARPVTVQCHGAQHFIEPRTRIAVPQADSRPRIAACNGYMGRMFDVTDVATGQRCKEACPPASSTGSPKQIPRRCFLRFEPGVAEVRTHRLDWLAAGLAPGRYKLGLATHGAWWAWESVEELCEGGKEYVSTFGRALVFPILFDSMDELFFEVVS